MDARKCLSERVMIGPILKSHRTEILRNNAEFVHWLSPLNDDKLDYILGRAAYQRQINEATGVLLGYSHDVDYPDHKNLIWLQRHANDTNSDERFFYIDRVIIARKAQGQGLGRRLYEDVICFARQCGYKRLVCEVNTKPNNPRSHAFHLRMGFTAI
ncbi:MAG: GNAT family N-acetyltransferase, partial [Litorimonas sp.]